MSSRKQPGTNEETIGFLRHSEIKHGRIAMFAFVGYIVHANGIKFPWAMQMDGTPFPSETNPPALWDAISVDAKWQIFSLIAFLEFWSELSTPNHKHYMKGGKPGDFPDFVSGPEGIPHPVPFNYYDPFKLSKNKSEESKARGLKAEINNGRLAMIGILGFLQEQTLPGSVPILSGMYPKKIVINIDWLSTLPYPQPQISKSPSPYSLLLPICFLSFFGTGVVKPYDGEVMAPFTENLLGKPFGL